jgi:hypothetical protein
MHTERDISTNILLNLIYGGLVARDPIRPYILA